MPAAGDAADPATSDRPADGGRADSESADAERRLREMIAGDPTRVDVLLDLAELLMRRGRRSGTAAFFDVATSTAEQAAAAAAPDHPLWPFVQAVRSSVASARYEATRRAADLSAAVRYAEKAVAAVDPAGPDGPAVLVKCVAAYLFSFERFGRLADIDTTVRFGRLIGRSADPAHRIVAQQSLGAALTLRFVRTGDRADIEEAIQHCRNGLALLPRLHDNSLLLRGTLALALVESRLRGEGSESDLLEAVRISRELVAVLPADGMLRPQALANHAVLLFAVAVEGQSSGHLAEAVRYAREAVGVTEHGERRARHLANLANLTLVQARLGGDPAGVRAAVDIGQTALAELSPGNPDRARALNVLGTALRVRHLIDRDPADLDGAIGMWRSAAGSPVGSVEIRMAAARNWARAATEERDSELALEAYSTAVGLLPLLAWRGLDRTVQERRLASTKGLACEAAAWSLAAGQTERAVELLEQGRQVLWSQAVQTRSDLSVLAAVDPELAADLDQTRQELDGRDMELDLLGDAMGVPVRPDAGDTGRRRRLAERWEALLARARRQPGLDRFLSPPSFDVLRPAARGGAVILVNTTKWRSDALIVTEDGVRLVPLRWLTHDDAQRRAAALLAAQRNAEAGPGAVAQAVFRQTLISIQRWLWDTVAEPVCAVLDEMAGDDRRHRVWWCPTGPLTMLPLHAAGRFGAAKPLAERRRLSVAARCVSSYTPSLSALLRTRSGPAPARPARAFAVGLGNQPGQAPLPAVSDELRAVSESMPGIRLLTGRSATVQAVLAALEQHGWAHFACHGEQDFDRPSAGALHLADGRLSLLELTARLGAPARTRSGSAPVADLAYLSACRTAAGGRDLPDEAIHLTAALQFAGFRHVIGSQWAVSDRVAAQVAGDVYAHLASADGPDSGGAAPALDQALSRVRQEHPDRPDLWAALIHTGP